jgi:hypothetical protein
MHTMFLRFFAEKVMLGRWKLSDFKTNKIKIDWANVDHCGTCAYKPKTKKVEPLKMALVVRPKYPLTRDLRV